MGLSIKWFPRSWVQIKTNKMVMYIDPSYLKSYFKNYSKKIKFPEIPVDDAELPESLEKADLILYTHAHKDHCKKITADLLSDKDTFIIGPKKCKKELGEKLEVIEFEESLEYKGVHIRTIPSYNTIEGSSTRKVHKKKSCFGYCIELDGRKIYHAGDSDLIPEMAMLKNIDIAFLPIGGTFTMNVEEAVQATLTINPKIVVPIHHLKADPQNFESKIKAVSHVEVKILEIGESFIVQ